MYDDLFFEYALNFASKFYANKTFLLCLKQLSKIHTSTYTNYAHLTSKGIEAFKKILKEYNFTYV